MKRLTIIIPYHNSPERLEETLLSLLENRPEESEILVVLDSPYENPYELQEDEVRFIDAAESDRSDAACIRAGVEACQSEFFQILPTGAKVDEGWCLDPLSRMEEESKLGALLPTQSHFWGLFFRKSVYQNLGGFSTDFIQKGHNEEFLTKLREHGWDYAAISLPSLDIPNELVEKLDQCESALIESMAHVAEKLTNTRDKRDSYDFAIPAQNTSTQNTSTPSSPTQGFVQKLMDGFLQFCRRFFPKKPVM
ncbi:MAG: glycosyltransferase [Planctomycetia bacterium]|nr:glycosyltransferase [Planctomycetia bacterium]